MLRAQRLLLAYILWKLEEPRIIQQITKIHGGGGVDPTQYLLLSGGTMTGDLVLNQKDIQIQDGSGNPQIFLNYDPSDPAITLNEPNQANKAGAYAELWTATNMAGFYTRGNNSSFDMGADVDLAWIYMYGGSTSYIEIDVDDFKSEIWIGDPTGGQGTYRSDSVSLVGKTSLRAVVDDYGLRLGHVTQEGSNIEVWDALGNKQLFVDADALENTVGTTFLARVKIGDTSPIEFHGDDGTSTLKLDNLATPDDNTDLNASTTAHGLLKKLPNDAKQFLNGVGSWVNPNWSLVSEVDVGAGGTSSVAFTGLDSDSDKAYLILAAITAANAVGCNSRIYFNNDKTDTNYWYQMFMANGATITGGRANEPFFGFTPNNQEMFAYAYVMRDPYQARYSVWTNIRDPASLRTQNMSGAWTTSATITRIDIDSVAANAIGQGSKIILFKAT